MDEYINNITHHRCLVCGELKCTCESGSYPNMSVGDRVFNSDSKSEYEINPKMKAEIHPKMKSEIHYVIGYLGSVMEYSGRNGYLKKPIDILKKMVGE